MNNQETVWKFLTGKGLSEQATAGIMGNIQAESGFDPKAVNSSNGAFGIFQWLGSRKESLINYAKETGRKYTDINVQLDYFWKELQGEENATLQALTKGEYTAEKYAEIFEEEFERSGGSNISGRKEYAGEIYSKYAGTSTGSTSPEVGLVWWGDIVRVVFAVAVIVGGVVFLGIAVTSTGKTGQKAVDKVKEKAKEVVKHD